MQRTANPRTPVQFRPRPPKQNEKGSGDCLALFCCRRLQWSQNGTIVISMRIVALSTLKAFWERDPEYADAEDQVLAWYRICKGADWAIPSDVKAAFGSASILKDGRAVFNIAGNKYRLVVWVNYSYKVVYVRFIGTHAQYDAVDAQTI